MKASCWIKSWSHLSCKNCASFQFVGAVNFPTQNSRGVIKCADHVIDLGPEGGDAGGNVIVTGTPAEVAKCAYNYTGQFLREVGRL